MALPDPWIKDPSIRRNFEALDTAIGPLGSIFRGTGDPENVVTAPIGSLYLRADGGAGSTLYVKESGTDDTGWQPK